MSETLSLIEQLNLSVKRHVEFCESVITGFTKSSPNNLKFKDSVIRMGLCKHEWYPSEFCAGLMDEHTCIHCQYTGCPVDG